MAGRQTKQKHAHGKNKHCATIMTQQMTSVGGQVFIHCRDDECCWQVKIGWMEDDSQFSKEVLITWMNLSVSTVVMWCVYLLIFQ